MKRCPWSNSKDIYIEYHDKEWGVPVFDDRTHFEFLVLESAQAGLSWLTILKRRENYKKAYLNFDVKKVSRFSNKKIEKLILDPGIIRNRRKIESSVNNAKCFIKIQKEFDSFTNYIWKFTDYKPLINKWKKIEDIPSKTELSDRISKDLKKRGFSFIGSTIIYSHLQATGIVNDHLISCYRYKEVQKYKFPTY